MQRRVKGAHQDILYSFSYWDEESKHDRILCSKKGKYGYDLKVESKNRMHVTNETDYDVQCINAIE